MANGKNEQLESSAASEPLQAAVIGYGAFGRAHASKYRTMPGCVLACVVDADAERRALAEQENPGVATFATVGEMLAAQAPDIANVVVPANEHFRTATDLLDAGVHCLVEKPLASTLAEARALAALAKARNLVLQPGHLERFNHTLAELHARMPNWTHVEARRMSRWSARATDVSVVMDLMIHDIDMVLELTDSPIVNIQARGVKVFSEHWDVVNAQLTFANGATANLTASRASLQPERRLHVFGDSACALANIDDGVMLLHRREAGGLATDRRFCRHEDPLGAEINAFVHSVRYQQVPVVDASDGCRAVEICCRIGEAIEHDQELLNRIAVPMADSDQATAYLQEAVIQ